MVEGALSCCGVLGVVARSGAAAADVAVGVVVSAWVGLAGAWRGGGGCCLGRASWRQAIAKRGLELALGWRVL